MRSPRIEGPPVLQPVTESAAAVTAGNRDSIETPVDDSASDEGNPATPPMPVLVEGEDFGDEDGSSFDLVEAVGASKLDAKSDASDAPPPLTNGLMSKEHSEAEAPPVITSSYDERVNGDHEEPVLEKFFRLFTPGAQSPASKEAVDEVLGPRPEPPTPPAPPSASTSTPKAPTSPKRRRPYTPRRKPEDRSPSAKRPRGKTGKGRSSRGEEVFDFDSEQDRPEPKGRKRGPKPKPEEQPKIARPVKDAPKASALENRYLRSPYIISTAESDSIMSRFQVVNPAFRDAASVSVTDQPFKHAVKLPPHAGLAKSAWVCVFCGLGTSFANLGCLFGPYYIDFNKFTAHADLISIAKPARPPREPSPPPAQAPPALAVTTPAPEEEEKEKEEGEEEEEEGGRRRTNRRLSRSSNNTVNHSSISSFRHSKARAAQPLLAAKDVRRGSTDSDKAPAHVKQVDIAAVFFSSDQPADKKEEAKVNGKEATRRRSEAKEEEKSAPEPPPPAASPTPPKRAVGKRKGAKPIPKPPRRAVGRPPKEVKEAQEAARTNNCQAKAAKPCEPRPSSEQIADTRIAANGEAWTHLECVLWASGTYLNGKQIVGLEDALSEALQTVCKVCKLRGAMVACVQRGCGRAFHYYCAIQDDCYLDYEQFCIYCSRHKKKNASEVNSYWSEPAIPTF